MSVPELCLCQIKGLPEILPGADLGALILQNLGDHSLRDGDILVVASKIVSKAENCIRKKESIHPSERALRISSLVGRDPKYIQLVLEQSRQIIRLAKGVLITRTRHGFVLANAGVDGSNAGGSDSYLTLPTDPDASAKHLRRRLHELSGKEIGIIISDTFGRAWRQGQTDVAIGCCGVDVFLDYRGETDRDSMTLKHSVLCRADALAGAAGLLMGKRDGVPVILIRGFSSMGEGTAQEIPYPADRDLFLDHQSHI